MKKLLLLLCFLTATAFAEGNLDVDTPVIAKVKASMSARHEQLKPFYESGAVGLTKDGGVAVRDPALVSLAQRQTVTRLVTAESEDRAALYREIARANGNPAWEAEIRSTFAQRWISRAPAGWWVQTTTGEWKQK
jgi:uncharacterized protein YdbL (DUF1318 family)